MCDNPTELSLFERVERELTEARKRRDGVALSTLGLLKSEIVDAGKEPGAGPVDDGLVLRVARREVKRRQEAAAAFRAAGREAQAEREEAEAGVLRAYLPAELDDAALEAEVRAAIAEVGATGPRAMGPVMRAAGARVAGRAESSRVAAMAKRLLG